MAWLDDTLGMLFGQQPTGPAPPIKVAPDVAAGITIRPAGGPQPEELRAYHPSFTESIGSSIQDLLMSGGMQAYPAGHIAHGLRDLLGFSPAGVPMAVGDYATARAQQNPQAAAAAVLGMVPGLKGEARPMMDETEKALKAIMEVLRPAPTPAKVAQQVSTLPLEQQMGAIKAILDQPQVTAPTAKQITPSFGQQYYAKKVLGGETPIPEGAQLIKENSGPGAWVLDQNGKSYAFFPKSKSADEFIQAHKEYTGQIAPPAPSPEAPVDIYKAMIADMKPGMKVQAGPGGPVGTFKGISPGGTVMVDWGNEGAANAAAEAMQVKATPKAPVPPKDIPDEFTPAARKLALMRALDTVNAKAEFAKNGPKVITPETQSAIDYLIKSGANADTVKKLATGELPYVGSFKDVKTWANSVKEAAPTPKAPVYDYEKFTEGGKTSYHIFDTSTGKTVKITDSPIEANAFMKGKAAPGVIMPKAPPAPEPLGPQVPAVPPWLGEVLPEEQRQAARLAGNYTTPAWRGVRIPPGSDFGTVYKGDLHFSSNSPELADMYSSYLSHHPGMTVVPHEGTFSPGASVSPLWLDTSKYHVHNAKGKMWSHPMANQAGISAAKEKGAPGVIIKNVWDEPNTTQTLSGPKDVYITFPEGASTVKSKFAGQFNPKSKDIARMLIGAIGGGMALPLFPGSGNQK